MIKPDYQGGSIVNLMASVAEAFGAAPWPYPTLRDLPAHILSGSRNVLLLVLDGLGDHLLQHAGAGQWFRGRRRGRMTSVFPATTATAIPVFHTGLAPQQHGLTGWYMYLRELGSVTAVLPLKPRCSSQPLGAGIDLSPLFTAQPMFSRLDAESWVVTHDSIIDSEFNRLHSTGAQRRPYHTLRQLLHRLEEAVKSGPGRKFIYGYYPELDAQAHVHGAASTEVETLLERLDTEVATLAQALAGTDTTLLVTADHGFIDVDPADEILLSDHPVLEQCLLLPLCGERRVAYCYVEPGRQGEFERYVRGTLGDRIELMESAQLIDDGWFGLGAPHPRLAERLGQYTFVMKGRSTVKDWILGEKHHRHVGVHGGVSEQEMYVPLIVVHC